MLALVNHFLIKIVFGKRRVPTPCRARLLLLRRQRVDNQTPRACHDCRSWSALHRRRDKPGSRRTGVDGEVSGVDSQDRNDYCRPLRSFGIGYKDAHDLTSEAKQYEADSDNEGPNNHHRPPTAPFGLAFVGDDADNRLYDETRERAGDPYKGRVALGESEVKEVWRTVWRAGISTGARIGSDREGIGD